jgi:hypothetical protein
MVAATGSARRKEEQQDKQEHVLRVRMLFQWSSNSVRSGHLTGIGHFAIIS